MTDVDELKRQAAVRAVSEVASGMVVGLGTGSTAVHATREIGARLANGALHDIVAIPTSVATASAARAAAIPLATLDEHARVDLTIDGADEVDPDLNLIKGLGGALLREKVVAAASRRMIVVVDHSKRVARLGERTPVPVEVIPFARATAQGYLQSLGARVALRAASGGQPFVTDEGNQILDCFFGPIQDPHTLAEAIRKQPGIVEHGLFLDMATAVIVAAPGGIAVQQR